MGRKPHRLLRFRVRLNPQSEIAGRLQLTVRSVERKLVMIRGLLEEEITR